MTLYPLTAFLLIATLLQRSEADPVHVPITRVPGSTASLDTKQETFRLRQRYGRTNASSLAITSRKRTTTVDVPVVNQNGDISYFATLNAGTPPQTFSVILDTGSSDLWLAGPSCAECPPNGTPIFNTSASTSFKVIGPSDITIPYGSGEVSGTVSSDTFEISGLRVEGQTFLDAGHMSPKLVDGNVSGLLGLAFQGIAATKGVPFWQALINSNQLESPEFAFWLDRAPLTNSDEYISGGMFTLGGTNPLLFSGDIDFVDMVPGTNSYWLLSLTDLKLNGKSIAISGGNQAISAIDTGTSLIGGPTADVEAFWAAVPNSNRSPDSGPGMFNVPCNQQLSVSMSFGGKTWPINSQDMIVQQEPSDPSLCVGAIFDFDLGTGFNPDNGAPGWVVGDTFLKNVYSVFRATPPAVGFAQLSSSSGSNTDSSIPGSPSSSGVDHRTSSKASTIILFAHACAVLGSLLFIAT